MNAELRLIFSTIELWGADDCQVNLRLCWPKPEKIEAMVAIFLQPGVAGCAGASQECREQHSCLIGGPRHTSPFVVRLHTSNSHTRPAQ